ncbi:putative caspase-like protein [Bradyrhizobium sp. i1.3.6]
MADVLALVNQSAARQVVVILDCCHSGAFGTVHSIKQDTSLLRKGVSILCASRASEAAVEISGRGLFTGLLLEALSGGAASLLGDVTVASLYDFVFRTIGPWSQQPLFKCHVSDFVNLRTCNPSIERSNLRQLTTIFAEPESLVYLDAAFETGKEVDPERSELFRAIRSFRSAGLVVPASEKHKHLYHVALTSGACRLNTLGKYYWNLVDRHLV